MSRHEPVELFDTSPPPEADPASSAQCWKRRAVDGISAALLPIVKAAARPYVGGETLDDAACVAERLIGEGFKTTLGYWDTGKESATTVATVGLDTIANVAAQGADGYVSLKPPALRFSAAIAGALAAAAHATTRLHGDSHGIDAVEPSNAMLQVLIDRMGGARVGTTLPGRWARSLGDADWAVERNMNVRVVKGQWPDPNDPKRDMSKGFLDVISRLAGKARHVAVATHDLPLARASIDVLRNAGTPCELEVLFGMPAKKTVEWAKREGVGVRIYVPFGGGYVPSALRVLKRNPRLLYVIAKDRLMQIFRG